MPFGNKAKPSRRFKFGARKPDNQGLVHEQLYQANKFGNALVEEEKKLRKEFRKALEEMFPGLADLQNRIQILDEKRKEKRQFIKDENKRQKKKVKNPTLSKEITAMGKEISKLRKREKEMRGRCNKKLKPGFDGRRTEYVKKLYHQFKTSLHWGTINEIKANRIKGNRDPKFHRFTGKGQLSVQIQKDMNFARLLSCKDNFARLELTTEWKKKGAQGNRSARGILWLRIGSDGRDPVWTKIPIELHREIPEDCLITNIHLIQNRVACQNKWNVQFVLAKDEWEKRNSVGNKRAAIDVGWRMTPEGLRVACYVGSDGKEDCLVIHKDRLDRWKKVDDLQSIRDKNFNKVLKVFKAWVKKYKSGISEEISERIKTLSHWRSQNRLAGLVNFWRQNRFDGDGRIFAYLEKWRVQDRHLYEWEDNQRKSNIHWRKNFYQEWALRLNEKYGEILIEKLNWADLQKERPEKATQICNSNRAIASVGNLCDTLKQMGAVQVSAVNTSKTCYSCKSICDLGSEQIHTCEHCGEVWDRDYNAPRNMLSARAPVA